MSFQPSDNTDVRDRTDRTGTKFANIVPFKIWVFPKIGVSPPNHPFNRVWNCRKF